MTYKIDFFARQRHFVDHMLPVWLALPEKNRGIFYIHSGISTYAEQKGLLEYTALYPAIEGSLRVEVPGENPVYTCAYGDFLCVKRTNPTRKVILAEHGIGLAFGDNAGYAGGKGKRSEVDCFFSTSQYVADKNKKVFDTPVYVIGVPKMDDWQWKRNASPPFTMPENPKVCISFHWSGTHISPEAGNAFDVFGRSHVLLELRKRFNLVAHCHPKERDNLIPVFQSHDIPFIELEEVFDTVDILVNDSSSIAYEFCVTGKPVILMNSPRFRKNVNFGIRFWDYSNIGRNVWTPNRLYEAIEETIKDPNEFLEQRNKMIADLFPYSFHASKMAIISIEDFLKEEQEDVLLTKHWEALKAMPYRENELHGLTDNEMLHLCYLGSQMPQGTVALDIGRNNGKSASCIASGSIHGQINARVVTIETTANGNNNPTSKVIFQNKTSYELEKMKRTYSDVKDIGLLFLSENIEQELKYWEKYMVSGAILAIHKVGIAYPETQKIVKERISSDKWDEKKLVGRIFTARKK